MNERIKLLAEQAWEYACKNTPEDGSIMMESVYDSKFAQLIIKECAAFVSGAAEVHTQEEQDACDRASKGLKNYFGIEE